MRIISLIAAVLVALSGQNVAWAGHFGGGGGGARFAGGGARPSFAGSPSFSGAGQGQFGGGMAARSSFSSGGSGGSMIPRGQYSAGSGGYQSMARPGGGQLASMNRPGAGGSGANAGNWTRPTGGNNWANRPGAGGSGERWPNAGNRPNWNNGSGGWTRPNNWVNNGTINRGNAVINQNNFTRNNVVNGNNRWSNAYINRPWGYNYYQSNWAGWHSGCWNNWNSCPAAWYTAGVGAGVGTSLLWGSGANYSYSNPFWTTGSVVTSSALDYSQPVQVPVVDNASYASQASYGSTEGDATADTTVVDSGDAQPAKAEVPPEASEHFDQAREAFKQEQYDTALKEVEQAIEVLPKDTTLHEFRALVLFAQGKYKDAAAGIYAVLAVGPGWNWQTLSGLYANPDTYTKQLRALESYVRNNTQAPDGHFLLAYHYLVIGSVTDAVTQLKDFEKLVPTDQLVPELVRAFTESPNSGAPKAEGA
jgi:Tetratricopeptide repeat